MIPKVLGLYQGLKDQNAPSQNMTKIIISMLGITCPPIEPIANGMVKVTGRYLGDTATYSCNEGFVMSSNGYTRRVCEFNNEWTGTAGICERK